MSEAEKDEEMICGLTTNERDVLQRELIGLPETMPPRIVWQRIRDQAEAEGLLRRPVSQRPSTWYSGMGLAATVVLAVLFAPKPIETPEQEFPTEVLGETQPEQMQLTALQALMVESRQLESDLRALPDEPRVVRASTAASMSELEDRIAAIDYQLGDPEFQLTAEERELFWRERVRLMKSLVQLRYAQAQRTAF